MLTEYQAQKLRHDMRKELNAGPGAVFACAACLLAVAVLSVIGAPTGAEDRPAAMVLTASAQPSAPQGAEDHAATVVVSAHAQPSAPQ